MGQVIAFTGAVRAPSKEESRVFSAEALASVDDAEVIPDMSLWTSRHESFAWPLLSPNLITFSVVGVLAAVVGFAVSYFVRHL